MKTTFTIPAGAKITDFSFNVAPDEMVTGQISVECTPPNNDATRLKKAARDDLRDERFRELVEPLLRQRRTYAEHLIGCAGATAGLDTDAMREDARCLKRIDRRLPAAAKDALGTTYRRGGIIDGPISGSFVYDMENVSSQLFAGGARQIARAEDIKVLGSRKAFFDKEATEILQRASEVASIVEIEVDPLLTPSKVDVTLHQAS